LLGEKKDKDANVEERIRNYKNYAACLSLSDRRLKAPEFYTTNTCSSQKFISPFSDGAFDFKQLTSSPGKEDKGFFRPQSGNNLGYK